MFRNAALIAAAALVLGLAGSTFGQIGPIGWWSQTIGTAAEGSAEVQGEAFEVTGNGADIWGTADGFHFMYQELAGDGSITARVVSTGTGTNTWAKGGVMIRDSLTAGSKHAMMVVTANSDGTAGNGAAFQWRPTADAASVGSSNTGDVIAAPYWVRIERAGDMFSAFVSADGQDWTQIGVPTEVPMTGTAYIGLCVTSHAAGELRTYTFDSVSTTGGVTERAPNLKARDPDPPSGTVGILIPVFAWTPGETAVAHNVYFGASPDLTEADLYGAAQTYAMYYHIPGIEIGMTYYWRVDEIDEAGVVHTGDVWTVASLPKTAYRPNPADGAEGVSSTPALSWTAGESAVEHHVYFGEMFDDVNEGIASVDYGTTTDTSFVVPDMLRVSTTYFWRVDEIAADGTVVKGPVWSFNTEDGIANKIVRQWWSNIGAGTAITDLTNHADYPQNPTGEELIDLFEGPVDWADNYGTRFYGWLTPPETGEYTFWIAGDDAQELWLSTDVDPAKAVRIANVASWTNSREWEKEANQKSAPITLQAGQKYYIEALGKEGGGGDSTAVAWEGGGIPAQTVISAEYVDAFALPPLRAFSPTPANGAAGASQTPVLSWKAGEQAQEHEVYFGDDAAAVAAADATSPLFMGRQADSTFEPGALEWGKTYYWRVDEVAAGNPTSPWVGGVWSFTTADFLTVDDFESYTDIEGSRIYETWVDGLTDGLSGSIVGYLDALNGTFGETVIVHGGGQSMPMDYDNSQTPFFSQATREFTPAQDWTVEGVDSLSLWVQGYPALGATEVVETNGAMSLTGAGADIWNNSDEFTYAYKTLNGDGTMTARVVSIGPGSNTWAKGGVMIRDSLNGGSTHAMMVLTANSDGAAGNGASFQYRATTDGASANVDSGSVIAPPYWVRMERLGDTLTGYTSSNGLSWTQMGTTIIAMEAPVYIGLCVTSHAAGEDRTFEFDNISSTGDVSGVWQGAVINAPRHNSDEVLYVELQDGAGNSALVTDGSAVTSPAWTEVKIPLSKFAGVNLSRVMQLVIGVGDPTTATAGGSGRIFIDDIRVVGPAPVVD